MRPANIALLADRGIVRVGGEDAEKLLQGVITNDMDLLGKQPAIHSALLSPQGKVLFEFFVATAGTGFLLETARAQSQDLLRRLLLYRLRAKVEIVDAVDQYQVFALWGEPPLGPRERCGSQAFVDPRLAQLGQRLIVETAVAAEVAGPGTLPATAADWHAHRIALGVPEAGKDYPLGDTFLHEANFDQLNGVSFSKGCFIGQEVASRMQHRGGGRKRVVLVEGQADLVPNAPIRAGTTPLGSLGSVNGRRALALVRLDRAAEALGNGAVLTAAGIAISLIKPAWASFDMAATRAEAR
ncbi:MAG TPA: folate-binding protein [Hyphomicrobiaceae bacterium]|jgi:folate-binding protein YgfZ|nr:folate-binding protein [Hyphomicrobiaceae bacterium]